MTNLQIAILSKCILFKRSKLTDSMNKGKSSELRKHGFGSLHNFNSPCYQNEGILLRHRLCFTNEVDYISLNTFLLFAILMQKPYLLYYYYFEEIVAVYFRRVVRIVFVKLIQIMVTSGKPLLLLLFICLYSKEVIFNFLPALRP